MPPGRPEFSQAGTNGGGQTVAVTNRPSVKYIQLNQSTDIPAGNSETTELYAPVGSVLETNAIYLYAGGPGGTEGEHQFRVQSAGRLAKLDGTSNNDENLKYTRGQWLTADKGATPEDLTAQKIAETEFLATEEQPIQIRYDNRSDTTQTNDRFIQIIAKESKY